MNHLVKINIDALSVATAILSILLAVSAYYSLLAGIAFGHDEVHYYKDFTFKLTEDGRWINHALLPLLRTVPNNLWLICYLAGLWVFFFNVANDLGGGRPYSAIVASFILTTPPYIHQSLWPATSSIGILALLIAQLASRKGVNHALIYFLFSPILFGTLQSYYFLLPLAFAKEIRNYESLGLKYKLKALGSHLLLWVLASIAGLILMSTVLLISTGHFGVSPAAWRKTQPIGSINDLFNNIAYVYSDLKTKTLSLFSEPSLKFLYFSILLMYAFSIRAVLNNLHLIILTLVVGISFFVFSIPLAPVIQERSLFAMAACFVLLLALPGLLENNYCRIISSFALLAFSFYYTNLGSSYLTSDQESKNLMINKIKIASPYPPQLYNGLALFGVAESSSKEGDFYNSAPLMHGLVHSIGFKQFRDCRIDKTDVCINEQKDRYLGRLPFLSQSMRFGVTGDNWLTLRLENE